MTKAEALKLAIDGKRIRHNSWRNTAYIIFDCDRGYFVWSITQVQYAGGDESLSSEGWEIYEESKPKEKAEAPGEILVCGNCELSKQVTGNRAMLCREHAEDYLGMKLPNEEPKVSMKTFLSTVDRLEQQIGSHLVRYEELRYIIDRHTDWIKQLAYNLRVELK